MEGRILQRTGAALGIVGIAAAAFGAHGLEKIASPEQVRWWAIAAAIQLVTLPVVLICAARTDRFRPIGGALLIGGISLFSGSLYAMALGAPRFLGAVTPLGGLLLMTGWATLAFPRSPPGGR
jgi:uncharacterized membrane protein YgdD (TMEM256/DUF423 family)